MGMISVPVQVSNVRVWIEVEAFPASCYSIF